MRSRPLGVLLLLPAAGVALVMFAVLLPGLGLVAALIGAALVVVGALARSFWVALLPLLPACGLAVFALTQSPAASDATWSGLLAFLLVLGGAGAAFCLALGAAVARLTAYVDLG